MAAEAELKFRVPARNVKAVANWHVPGGKLGGRSDSDLVSTYFDRNAQVERHGLTLHVRQNGKTHIRTVKSANGRQFDQGEWETEIEGDAPDLGKADGTPLEQFSAKKLRRKLKPVFATSVHRTSMPAGGRQRDQSDGLQDGMRPAFSSAMNLSFSTRVGIMEDFLHSSLGVARAGPIGRVYAVTSPAS